MKRRIARLISFARALWVAGLLTVVAGATAQASLIHYVITNNGGLLAGGTGPVSIAGQFTYDTSTMAITGFNVTLTTAAPFKGLPRDDQNRPAVVRVVEEPPAAIPEPSTWAMVLGAFAGAAAWMRATRRPATMLLLCALRGCERSFGK